MKKFIMISVLLALLLSLSAGTSFKMKEYPFYGTINASLFRITGNGSTGSTAGLYPSLKLGYNYNRYFALELSGGWGKTKPSDPESSGLTAFTTANDNEAVMTMSHLDLGIHLNAFPQAGANPYFGFGIGQMNWSVEKDAIATDNFAYGDTFDNIYVWLNLGIESKINDRFSLNFDFKRKMIFGDTDNMLGVDESPDSFSQVGIGVCFKFGRGVYEKIDLEAIEAVHFEFNSIHLTKRSKLLVKQVAEAMKKNHDLVLEVRGFTDNTGSDSVNLRMSKKRAISVKQMLVSMGVPSSRIITTAMGHNNPIATNSTPEGRAMNRRVEFYELEK